MNTTITPDHLARTAYVYIRQSKPDQVRDNQESSRRQYALKDHVRTFGWEEVVVIDDDQGHSGSGTARSGFDQLVDAVCEGKVGVVVALEVSRMARNGREWHTLMDYCAIVDTLLMDEHGVYNARDINHRLLLGLKGTFAEMELATFRQRSQEALKLMAARGELYAQIPIGYVLNANGEIEKTPDARVREAIGVIFRKFAEIGTVRQVLLWHQTEGVLVPCTRYVGGVWTVEWKVPVYSTLLFVLRNPIYAGAYAYGRNVTSATVKNGRKHLSRHKSHNPGDWRVLIRDHHEGYISWEVFEYNQRIISNNANMFRDPIQGSVRRGEALLAGLLRCGHCGHKLYVIYAGDQGAVGRYHCRGKSMINPTEKCIGFGAGRVDVAVSAAVLQRLQPLGIEAALKAVETQAQAGDDVRRHVELALEQARYQESLARRQYDAVDPLNRLVASELERRWNERLVAVAELEEKLATMTSGQSQLLSPDERKELLELGEDLQKAWYHPGADAITRKRILRAVLEEIVVRLDGDMLDMKLHWKGGDHTQLVVQKPPKYKHRYTTDTDTTDLIRALARLMPDARIARLLNMLGRHTSKGNTWNAIRIRGFRNTHDIAIYRDGERAERGEVNLEEAATILDTNKWNVLRLIERKVLPAQQACKGAPWVIRRGDVDLPAVRHAVTAGGGAVTLTENPDQEILDFQ